jgi:hypothetical protein
MLQHKPSPIQDARQRNDSYACKTAPEAITAGQVAIFALVTVAACVAWLLSLPNQEIPAMIKPSNAW